MSNNAESVEPISELLRVEIEIGGGIALDAQPQLRASAERIGDVRLDLSIEVAIRSDGIESFRCENGISKCIDSSRRVGFKALLVNGLEAEAELDAELREEYLDFAR